MYQAGEQDNESIGWAKWSWNPVTGTLSAVVGKFAKDLPLRELPVLVAYHEAPGAPVQSLWSGRFYCTTHSASGVIRSLWRSYSEAPIVATAPQLAHMTVLGTGPVR